MDMMVRLWGRQNACTLLVGISVVTMENGMRFLKKLRVSKQFGKNKIDL